jgi:hypothetical protein
MAKSNRLLQGILLGLIVVWVFIVGMIVTNEQVYAALMVPLIGK